LAICGLSNGFKLFERDGRVDWGGWATLVKGGLGRQEA
jgi:hypothetical protein